MMPVNETCLLKNILEIRETIKMPEEFRNHNSNILSF